MPEFHKRLSTLKSNPFNPRAAYFDVEFIKKVLDKHEIPHPDWFLQVAIPNYNPMRYEHWARYLEDLIKHVEKSDLKGAQTFYPPPKYAQDVCPPYFERWRNLKG